MTSSHAKTVSPESPDLRSLDLERLASEMTEGLGERAFRAKQIYRWLHKRCAASFEEMTDLSRDLRMSLRERYRLDTLEIDRIERSSDGTSKLGLRTRDGLIVESVHIPEWRSRTPQIDTAPDRSTLCISSQVGCNMGCRFCLTSRMGLVRNLTVGEILDQVYRACRWLQTEGNGSPRPITNLVFMGMGEPLNNYANVRAAIDVLLSSDGLDFSHRHMTVSTSGVVPALERLGRETDVKVAVSLTGTTDEVRSSLMPVNERWPLKVLLEACRRMPLRRGRRITFEYVLIRGITDSLEDVDRLAHLLRSIPSKVNLISYNECSGLPFKSPSGEQVERFRSRLAERGFTAVVRRSRGSDIAAACGQLATSGQK